MDHKTTQQITVIIIAENEAKNLPRLLKSCRYFDSIVVIDSGSTDETQSISESFGCKWIHQPWLGFGLQKQFATQQSTTPWILSLDADEMLTEDLINEIMELPLTDPTVAYAIKRQSYFLDRLVKYSGWQNDYVVRLFNKSECRFDTAIVHEAVQGFKKIRKLQNPMLHFPYPDVETVKRKIVLYSELGALRRSKAGKRNSIFKGLLKSFYAFFRTFIIKGGVIDGRTGLKIAFMNAQITYKKCAS